MNRAAIGFIVTMSIPGVAHAQAPVITSNGDPSINDSIVYAGAVQPSNYPGQPYVLLFDDGVARLDVNGSRQVTYRQVVQILTQKGAERWGELEYHYNPDRAGFRLNWLRVRLNGELVSDGPAFQQETMPDVSFDAPVYTDVRIQRMTVAGLEPGAILDVSYTYETFRPAYADDFRFTWMINQMVDVRRSRFIVDVPQDVAPRVFERNLPDGVREYVADGRRVLEWHAEALPAIEWEPLAGWPNDIAMTVSVSSQLTWDDISGWYHDLSHDHYSLNADVRHALAEQLVDAHSVRDSILAVHRWVAQDFRYVSLSLGDGGYEPRTPAAIFETKFGDCKDKATLFIGILADLGIVAYPVLARSSGRVDSLVPTMLTFDHMIAAVETPRGREYADLTSAITPFGRLPYELQGGTALLVRPDEGEIVTLPVDDAESSLREVYVTGELAADGSFDGALAMRVTGVEEFALRQIIGNLADLDEADIVSLGEELTNEYFARAVVDSAEVLDGHDLTTPPSITTWFSVSDAVTWSGEKVVLSLPLPDYTMDTWVSELEADSLRQFPIATKDFNGPSRHRTEFVVVLPPGWRAELPPNVEVEGTFGVYRSVYVQQGRTVRAMREMSGRRGNEPPDSIAVLKAWMWAVSQDRAEYVVIEKLADTVTKDSLDAVVSVPLVFAWPIGMKTRVRQRYTQIRTGAGGVADTTISELSHRMGVREHELGRLIVFDDHQLELDSGQMDLDVEGVSEFLGRLSPSFVVDDTGNLLTFEDWDAFIETTRELIQPMLDSLEPGVLGVRDVMDRFLTEEFIYSKAMELWGPLVYFWSETEMEVGVPYESESDEPSPLYPETLIPYNYVHQLESRVPCTVGTTDSACVRLSMTSRADPEAVGKLLTQLFADMLRDGGDIISAMESMDVTSTVTLVAEPETLIPHHLTVAQNVSTTMRDSTGTVSSNNQLRKREYRFEHSEFPADLAHPSELFRAASSGDHDAVAKAIENGADLEQRDPNGRTPLIAAAAGGHGAVVRLLVSGGAHVNATDRTGTSALFWAAKTGQGDVSDLLVREGADVRLAYMSIRANGDIEALHGLIRVGLSPPPGPIDGLRSAARAAYNAGNLAEALPLFVDDVAQDTSDANSIAWVAEVQRRLNQPQQAVASARMAIERVECHGHALNVIAAAYNPRHSHWDHVNADTSWVYLQRSVECAPEDGNGWLEMVYSSAERGLLGLQREALGHLASTGFFPPSVLAAARWTLQDLPEDAVLLTHGELDAYQLLTVQEVERLRPDVTVVDRQMLNFSWYRSMIVDRHGMVDPGDIWDSVDSTADLGLEDALVSPSDSAVVAWRLAALDGRLERPLTFAITAALGPPLVGPGDLEFHGPYSVVVDSSEPVDPREVYRHYETLEATDFAGSDVDYHDRSPLRQYSEYGLNAATVAFSAILPTTILGEGDWVKLDTMVLRDMTRLLEWGERFARNTDASNLERIISVASDQYLNIGRGFARHADFPSAIQVNRKAASLDPDGAKGVNNIGYYSLIHDDVETALVYLKRAYAIRPTLGLLLNLEDASRLAGDVQEAKRWHAESQSLAKGAALEDEAFMWRSWHYNYLDIGEDVETSDWTIVEVSTASEKLAMMHYWGAITAAVSGDGETAMDRLQLAMGLSERTDVHCVVHNRIDAFVRRFDQHSELPTLQIVRQQLADQNDACGQR